MNCFQFGVKILKPIPYFTSSSPSIGGTGGMGIKTIDSFLSFFGGMYGKLPNYISFFSPSNALSSDSLLLNQSV